MKASLVMRDRETDSWWSIMTSSAIAGALDGSELDELPIGEKATWGDWQRRHPETLVLSVAGVEHRASNPYDEYFASERTFRDLETHDERLPPKEPVFGFWLDGASYVVPYPAFEGGRLFEVPDGSGRQVLLYREPGAALFASTKGWLVETSADAELDAKAHLARASAGDSALSSLDGIDTFWYTWISVNPESVLVAPH